MLYRLLPVQFVERRVFSLVRFAYCALNGQPTDQ